jgi:hypothetical protein
MTAEIFFAAWGTGVMMSMLPPASRTVDAQVA